MKPAREHATHGGHTYFVTSQTYERRLFFGNERWAKLMLEVLNHYRERAYLLHEFVIMKDHFHLLMTPKTSLEKAVQFIKGGFSFRAKRDLGYTGEVWQPGFPDHRIRDSQDYEIHRRYIFNNPVKKKYVSEAHMYPYSSASGLFELDPAPRWLTSGAKAREFKAGGGTAKAVPFQSEKQDQANAVAVQDDRQKQAKAVPSQSKVQNQAKAVPLPKKEQKPTEGVLSEFEIKNTEKAKALVAMAFEQRTDWGPKK
ncbi:MAG TPA: transposase [Candidatus Angelobacter sp.]|nr:transposase [Candidatus Angelobacter sp.]